VFPVGHEEERILVGSVLIGGYGCVPRHPVLILF